MDHGVHHRSCWMPQPRQAECKACAAEDVGADEHEHDDLRLWAKQQHVLYQELFFIHFALQGQPGCGSQGVVAIA